MNKWLLEQKINDLITEIVVADNQELLDDEISDAVDGKLGNYREEAIEDILEYLDVESPRK